MPALAGVAIFTVFLIGPLTTHQSIWDYFTSKVTWGYFSIVSVFFPAYNLPGVFTHNFTDRVNGALWTLPIESTMYLIILIAGVLGILNKKRLATLMALSAVGIYLYFNVHFIHALIPVAPHDTIDLLKYYSYYLSPFNPLCFLMGSAYYLNRDIIKFDFRIVVLAAIIWLLSALNFEILLLTSFICLPYIVLGTAFTSIPYINRIGKKADISYGLYIYHYPVQQTLANFFQLDPLKMFIATMVIVVPLAWISWHLIEKRALGLKNIDFKKYFASISGPITGIAQAIERYCKSIAGKLIRPTEKHREGKGAISKTAPRSNSFLGYLSEMRYAIILVAGLYLLFSLLGFVMSMNYQGTTNASSAAYVNNTLSAGNMVPVGLAIGIFVNNVVFCLMAMVLGLFLGIIPLVFIITNGLTQGWFAGISVQKACLCYMMAGSLPQGLLAIPAVLLSSAIGLKLGYSLIMSMTGKKGLVQELKKSARAFIFLVLPIIVVAAVVEALITLPLISCISGWI